MKVMINWKYKSGLGQFEKGDVVDLNKDMITALNNDSPGVVSEAAEPAKDRQVKKAHTATPKKEG
jgi:hypothetical protein